MSSAYAHLAPTGALVTIDPVYHRGQAFLSRLIISLDRGRQVRTPEQYTALATTYFPGVEGQVVTDMLPIPYSHFLMRARKTGS